MVFPSIHIFSYKFEDSVSAKHIICYRDKIDYTLGI